MGRAATCGKPQQNARAERHLIRLPLLRIKEEWMTDGPIARPGTGAAPSSVPWPAGPHYFDLTGSVGAVAWVRYRVWAADWHTRTLRSIADPDGNYDRLVGIEMALDGALNNLSGAFDASMALLIQAAENNLDLDESDRLQVHKYSWKTARDMLSKLTTVAVTDKTTRDAVRQVIVEVDEALEGESDPAPTGWLAQLRRLRNHVAHQETLARHHNIGGPSTVRAFGGQDVDTFVHLAKRCDQIHDLTEQMVSLAIQVGNHEVHAGWERPRWFPSVGRVVDEK